MREKKDLALTLHGTERVKVSTGRPMVEVTRCKSRDGRKVVTTWEQKKPWIQWSLDKEIKPSLATFVGPESWMIFQQLDLKGSQVKFSKFIVLRISPEKK